MASARKGRIMCRFPNRVSLAASKHSCWPRTIRALAPAGVLRNGGKRRLRRLSCPRLRSAYQARRAGVRMDALTSERDQGWIGSADRRPTHYDRPAPPCRPQDLAELRPSLPLRRRFPRACRLTGGFGPIVALIPFLFSLSTEENRAEDRDENPTRVPMATDGSLPAMARPARLRPA
jgi:hypothetical protein